ncbi:MAG: acetyl-CoA carboxylase biotin carboxyl carrier protein [Clostridia bacterium]
MEYENIKNLIKDVGESNLSSINIDFPDGTKISMKKSDEKEIKIIEKNEKEVEETSKKETGNIITSSLVGTFYIKPSPSSNPYVEIGSKVNKGDTVCIIEAMKLMNEIESEYTGTIKEIYVKDGEPVEYGSKLFRIE